MNFLSAGRRPAASKTRQTRPFPAVSGRPWRFEAPARHQTFKAVYLRFKAPVLAVSSGPRRAFADGIFLVFLGISALNDLFAPVEAVAVGCVALLLEIAGPIFRGRWTERGQYRGFVSAIKSGLEFPGPACLS